jgi:F0F1-type ATP synthase alpha subunit
MAHVSGNCSRRCSTSAIHGVVRVAAFEIGDPVAVFVLVVADDLAQHATIVRELGCQHKKF